MVASVSLSIVSMVDRCLENSVLAAFGDNSSTSDYWTGLNPSTVPSSCSTSGSR